MSSCTNNSPLVSIIVPAKNSAIYLPALWGSIKKQSIQNFELIFIDNGSTDNTLEVARQLCAEDKRVNFFELKRGGVSAARNLGLKKAHAGYVMFVDSDDELQENSIEKLLRGIKEKDICIGKAVRRFGKKTIANKESKLAQPTQYELINAILNPGRYALGRAYDLRTVWAKLYKKSFIESTNTRFDESITTFEDGLFNIHLFSHKTNVSIIDEYVYIYNVHSNSSIHKNQKDIIEQNEKKFKKANSYARRGLCNIDDVGHFSIELLIEIIRKSTLNHSSIIEFTKNSNISTFIRETSLKLNFKDNIVKKFLVLGLNRTLYRCLS